jgi:recombination protein RecA
MKKDIEKPKAQEKDTDLDKLLGSLQDKFGEGAIMKLDSVKKVDTDVVSTGSFSLDLALGVGGLPLGRIVEIFGPESSGKSTMALHVIAEVQKKGGKVAYIDAEHAMDPDYAKKLGVKIEDLLVSQPDSGEDALNILEGLVRSGIISAVIIDSVAALTPRAEIEGEMGAQFIGLQARMMSQALRKITALADRSKTLIIFINQLREKIGMMGYGEPTTTPGGRALKFMLLSEST